jgi:recombination DNA repair RAD52 pathway protein
MEQQINNEQAIMQALYAPFPEEMEKVMTLSGVNLKFIPVSEVINRLNKVLGVDGWSFEIISCDEVSTNVDELSAHVSLTVDFGNGKRVVKHAVGGATIKRIKSTGKPLDYGNSRKMAVSDALKKAAQQLGVGLYLSRSADAIDVEEAIAPKTELEEKWETFVDITKGLSKEQKTQLNDFWATHSNGKPKPTKTTATLDELQALVVEALRLQFGGKYVDNK